MFLWRIKVYPQRPQTRTLQCSVGYKYIVPCSRFRANTWTYWILMDRETKPLGEIVPWIEARIIFKWGLLSSSKSDIFPMRFKVLVSRKPRKIKVKTGWTERQNDRSVFALWTDRRSGGTSIQTKSDSLQRYQIWEMGFRKPRQMEWNNASVSLRSVIFSWEPQE